MESYDVFISYRRDGGGETARLLRIALKQHGYRVFLDVDDLASGHFDDRLLQLIAETPHFIVILSPRALEGDIGSQDWLRTEIKQALKTDRNIVPLLMPGFDYPSPDRLPPELQGIERHNGVVYSHQYFDATVNRLIQHMPRQGEIKQSRRAVKSELSSHQSIPSETLDADAYRAFAPLPATPYIVFGLLTAWVYVALGVGRALVNHMQGRKRYFNHHVEAAGLVDQETQRSMFTSLAGLAFEVDSRWPSGFALALAVAGAYTAGLFLYFPVYGNLPLVTYWPLVLVGFASLLFYTLVVSFVFWFRNTLKRHDHFERLLFRWLNDSRVGPGTLPERGFSSRWENYDQHVALFAIVGLPVMLSPTLLVWYLLYESVDSAGHLMVPVWLLAIAAVYHLWGVSLLRRLYHGHLASEQE